MSYSVTERSIDHHQAELEKAQQATEWFADMIYGLRDDIPNDLPQIALQRLTENFDSNEAIFQKLNRIRDAFIGLEYEGQLGFSLYFSGYPSQSLDVLLDDPLELQQLIATHFPKDTSGKKPPEMIAEIQDREVTITRTARPLDNITDDKDLMEVFARSADNDLAWQALALCAQTDPDMFFPEKGGSTREAKKTCLNCEVREACLDHALDNDERFGIWGGKSERERRKLHKERNPKHTETKVYLTRHKRVHQLLEAVGLAGEQLEEFSADQPRFARLVYTLLSEAYSDDEDMEETREDLKLYFVTARKRSAIEPIIDSLEDDLHDFFGRLSTMMKDYQNQEVPFVDYYARLQSTSDRAGQFAVSRIVRKRSEQEKARDQEEREASRVY